MNWSTLAQALWLALPVIVAGAFHVTALRLNVLPRLAHVPLDGGATVRGRRVFGANKTLRGALVMVAATVLCAWVQAVVAGRVEWARTLTVVEFALQQPVGWGVLLGVGYIVGELPNSFVKRQLDIAPGGQAAGLRGGVFWVVDQVDSLIGVLVFMLLVWVPPAALVAWLLVVTLIVHPAVAFVMLALGLKTRVG